MCKEEASTRLMRAPSFLQAESIISVSEEKRLLSMTEVPLDREAKRIARKECDFEGGTTTSP